MPGRFPLITEREDGDFYRRSWDAVVAAAQTDSIVAVETWNELHEATDIAHSQEYGRTYIEMTRQYADAFHQGLTHLP